MPQLSVEPFIIKFSERCKKKSYKRENFFKKKKSEIEKQGLINEL